MEIPRRDGIDADVLAPPRGGQLAGQSHQSGLGRRVRREMRAGDRRLQSGDRRDVDDPPPPPPQHLAARRLREQKCTGQIDINHPLPLLERHVLGRRCPGDAGVVDENVDLAERRHRAIHYGLDVGRPGHVAPKTFDVKAAAAHLLDRRREPFLAARAEHQRGPGLGQPFGHLAAQSARSAGHDRDAAGQ